ncbi:MAG: hypothetical protein ACPK85_10415, partial [Methanosarcina sp.]
MNYKYVLSTGYFKYWMFLLRLSQNPFLPINSNFSKLLMLSGAQLIIWNTGLRAIILSLGWA